MDSHPPPGGRAPTIAIIGSHGVRKSTAVDGIIRAARLLGVSTATVGEVIRTSPLGHNELATPHAQLWVLATQVTREIEAGGAGLLVTDRSVVDNYAYYRRAAGDDDPFNVEPLVAAWAGGYMLHLRLLPDVALEPDGFRSPDPRFRDDIEGLLTRLVPALVPPDRLEILPASAVTTDRDWRPDVRRWLGKFGGQLSGGMLRP